MSQPAPDGGWGWLVVAASFGISFLVDGVSSCFGVLLPELSDHLGASIATTAWAGSALCGAQLLVGPVASALVNKFGCCTIAIFGSLVASFSFILSAAATDVSVFIFMYGVMGGVGLGMMYLPAVVAVSLYFEQRRALATGIAVCGSGVGTFCLAPLTHYLQEASGWKGAQIATALVLLAGVALGGLLGGPVLDRCASRRRAGTAAASSDHDQRPPGELELPLEPPEFRSVVELSELPCAGARTSVQQPPTVGIESGMWPAADIRGHGLYPADIRASGLCPADNQRPNMVPSTDVLASGRHSSADIRAPNACSAEIATLRVCVPALTRASSQVAGRPVPFLGLPEVIVESASPADVVPALAEPDGNARETRPRLVSRTASSDAASARRQTAAAGDRRRPSRSPLPPVTPALLRPPAHAWTPLPALVTPRRCLLTPGLAPRCVSVGPTEAARPPSPTPRPLDRPDLFYSGRVRRAAPHAADSTGSPRAGGGGGRRGAEAVASDVQRILGFSAGSSGEAWRPLSSPVSQRPSAPSFRDPCAVLREMLDLGLLYNRAFLFTCLGYSLSMLGYFVPVIFILDEAIQHGVEAEHAVLLVAVLGASATVGRLLVGLLGHLRHVDVLLLNNACLLGSGLVALLLPLCSTYSAFAAACTIFGLFSAANCTLSPLVLLEMVGLERLTNAFGLTMLFRGVAAVLGAPLAGFVAEKTGSYDEPFLITGFLLLASSALGFLAAVWKK